MDMLAVQTGRFDHLSHGIREVTSRFPGAAVTGMIRSMDVSEAKASGLFTDIVAVTNDRPECVPPTREGSFDYCLIPFEDRFGIQYWTFRSVPIRLKIPRIASYDKNRRLKEFSFSEWVLNTLFMTTIVRALWLGFVGLRKVWWKVRRSLSISLTFLLAIFALALKGAGVVGLHPAQWRRRARAAGRKRVILHIPSLGLGGAQRQLAVVVAGLDRTCWDVEVVTVDALDKFFEPTIRAMNVTVHYLSPHWQLYEVGMIWQLTRLLYRTPVDVVHNWLYFAGAVGAIAGTLAGVPTIIESVRSEHPSRFPWFFPLWERVLYLVTAPLHTLVIANSQAVRRENRCAIVLPDRKIVTIYNGIDLSVAQEETLAEGARIRRDLGLPHESPIVGIVGRLSPEKDHASFLRAARLVSRELPQARFVIVGSGPLEPDIRALIDELALADSVILTGQRQDALALMRIMDVLVLTSLSEGFPNVLLEAAACGIAAVTTAAGGAAEVVLDGVTGFVVPCGDIEGIAGKTLTLIRDPRLRRIFAEAAKQRARRLFSSEQAVAAIQACYAGRSTRSAA